MKQLYLSIWRIDGTFGEYEKVASYVYHEWCKGTVMLEVERALEEGYSARVSLIPLDAKIQIFDHRSRLKNIG